MAEHTKWNSQPTYCITDVAYFLNTSPENINALISLNLIKALKLKTRSIPQFEIERFIKDNLGKDLSKVIKDEQERKKAIKSGRKVVSAW